MATTLSILFVIMAAACLALVGLLTYACGLSWFGRRPAPQSNCDTVRRNRRLSCYKALSVTKQPASSGRSTCAAWLT